MLETTCPVLTFQPTRYISINPVSSPTTANPRMKLLQFSFPYSAIKFGSFVVVKYIMTDAKAPTRYVTDNDANGLRFCGVDFVQILYKVFDKTAIRIGINLFICFS